MSVSVQTLRDPAPLEGQPPAAGAIAIEGISKSYEPGVMALERATLEIPSGEFVALLGPSGSGKSTLLSLVAGFLEPDEGRISIAGQDVRRLAPHQRNVGVVFQHYALFPHMSVADNVAFSLRARGWRRGRVEKAVSQALEMVGLAGFEHRSPAQLSGGEQQRVALARALVYQPPVLLLDEPLAALDRRLRDTMQGELKRLHQQLGMTFIFVTHDQGEALGMADRIVVMHDGLIEQIGAPRDVYERPATEFVANFIGDCNLWRGTAQAAGGELVVRHDDVVLYRGAGTAPGGGVCVAMRPEWVSLVEIGASVPPGCSCVPGTIAQQRYRGSDLLLECRTSLGLVKVQSTPDLERYASEGLTAVRLAWRPDRGVVLARGSGDANKGGS